MKVNVMYCILSKLKKMHSKYFPQSPLGCFCDFCFVFLFFSNDAATWLYGRCLSGNLAELPVANVKEDEHKLNGESNTFACRLYLNVF